MREGSLLPDRVGTKSVNKKAAARRGGAGIALGEAADSRAKVSSLFRFRVFPQSLKEAPDRVRNAKLSQSNAERKETVESCGRISILYHKAASTAEAIPCRLAAPVVCGTCLEGDSEQSV